MIPGLRSPRSLTRGYYMPPLRGWLARTSSMSVWLRTKERTGRRSLYLLDVLWELALLFLDIGLVLVVVFVRGSS